MKRFFALMLALLMGMTSFAWAETVPAAQWTLTLQVLNADGEAWQGLDVTVRNAAGDTVVTAVTDDMGGVTALLDEGVYRVKAVDPADGWSTATTVGLYEDVTAQLILRKRQAGSKASVGSVTKVSGEFFTDMFGNNTSDIDVRAMLHGYDTVAFTNEASYAVDETVATVNVAAADGNGNKLYVFAVQPGLTYSDGTPITARDYVFSVLLQSAPQTVAAGGMTTAYTALSGYAAYNAGTNAVFAGVRLIDDMTFSLNISGAYLPYYYELTYVSVKPYPIDVIAPGCVVADDGDGAYITSAYDVQGNPQGVFSAEVLAETLRNADTGYCHHPSVTSGPYTMESYDLESGTVVMKANERYQGNYEGQRPLIETVTLTETTNDGALAALEAGTLDIVNKLTDSDVITAGNTATTEGLMQSSNYLRSGLGFLSFACEQGPTAYAGVRQAVSSCLDQDTFVTAYTGNYGLAVYSWYGLGQWMAAEYVNEMDQHVSVYPLDLEAAKAALEREGWTLNAEGKAFTEGVDTVRYRKLSKTEIAAYDALDNPVVAPVTAGKLTLLPLKLSFGKVKDNRMSALVEEQLLPNLRAVGFEVEVTEVSFTDMLNDYYRKDGRRFNMVAMATNFTFVFDPYGAFNGDAAYQGVVNTTGINDKQLLQLTEKLRGTTPGDEATYKTRWMDLMARFSELLPAVPLYSNVYFDFCANDVQDYSPSAHWSWPSAILYTWRGEPLVTTPTDLGGGDDMVLLD